MSDDVLTSNRSNAASFIPAWWERKFNETNFTYQDPTLQSTVVHSGGDTRDHVLGWTTDVRPPNPEKFETWEFEVHGHGHLVRSTHPEMDILDADNRQPVANVNEMGWLFGTDKHANNFGLKN
jgi:hypothetical protein